MTLVHQVQHKSNPPVYCSKCGRALESSHTIVGASYDVTTGEPIKRGTTTLYRYCKVYWPKNHDYWEFVEGSENWLNIQKT